MKSEKFLYKIFYLILLLFLLSGSGYVGTLPDLGVSNTDNQNIEENKTSDVLPLDKLTVPTKYRRAIVEESPFLNHQKDSIELIRLLEKLDNILNTDNSIKKFVANSNIFMLNVKNYNKKYPGKDHYKQRVILNSINDDTIKMKDYWLYCNNNKSFILNSETNGAYSHKNIELVKMKYKMNLEKALIDLKMLD